MSFDSQRDMDMASRTESDVSEVEMSRILSQLTNALSYDPKRLARLVASQDAFNEYRETHLALITSEDDGTSAPLKRNLENLKLLEQRAEILKIFLSDSFSDH